MALGAAGQVLIVYPDFDLIAAFTSGLEVDSGQGVVHDLFDSFILPAVQSDEPLPEDPAALAELDGRIQALAEPEPAAVPPLPPTAARISGQTYTMDDDSFAVSSLRLDFEPDAAEATLTMGTPGGAYGYAVGLDEVPRMTAFASGHSLMKGRWIDDRTFEFEWGALGDPYYTQILIEFEDATVKMHFQYHGYYEGSWQGTGTLQSD